MADPTNRRSEAQATDDAISFSVTPAAEADPEALDRQAALGEHLRSLYAEVLEEPVPDQFLALLADLERAENER